MSKRTITVAEHLRGLNVDWEGIADSLLPREPEAAVKFDLASVHGTAETKYGRMPLAKMLGQDDVLGVLDIITGRYEQDGGDDAGGR